MTIFIPNIKTILDHSTPIVSEMFTGDFVEKFQFNKIFVLMKEE